MRRHDGRKLSPEAQERIRAIMAQLGAADVPESEKLPQEVLERLKELGLSPEASGASGAESPGEATQAKPGDAEGAPPAGAGFGSAGSRTAVFASPRLSPASDSPHRLAHCA